VIVGQTIVIGLQDRRKLEGEPMGAMGEIIDNRGAVLHTPHINRIRG
jgi:hypothetical protein